MDTTTNARTTKGSPMTQEQQTLTARDLQTIVRSAWSRPTAYAMGCDAARMAQYAAGLNPAPGPVVAAGLAAADAWDRLNRPE